MPNCVFTGDLIASRRAGSQTLNATIASLELAAAEIGRWNGGASHFTRFRGDGWQVFLAEPRFVLRALVLLFASAKMEKSLTGTRIGIGKGEVILRSPSLADAEGSAAELAGEALDGLKGRAIFGAEGFSPAEGAMLRLGALVAQNWTPAQAEAMFSMLARPQPSQVAVAQRLGIKPASLADRLTNAGFDGLEASFQQLELGL